jgi:futalosine hydrolase
VRVLVVAATRPEVAPLISALTHAAGHNQVVSGTLGQHKIDVLLTGVGMVATAAWCTRALAIGGYDVSLNLGVCGSFNPSMPPSSVVHVTSDVLAELGVEDGPRFLSLHEVGLLASDEFPYSADACRTRSSPPCGIGRPAGRVRHYGQYGPREEASIAAIQSRYAPDVESMEGAAFMYACLIAGVPFAQVRAVSNRLNAGTARPGTSPAQSKTSDACR